MTTEELKTMSEQLESKAKEVLTPKSDEELALLAKAHETALRLCIEEMSRRDGVTDVKVAILAMISTPNAIPMPPASTPEDLQN